MTKKIPWRDTKNRRMMRDCFMGRQLPQSIGIAQRTELSFYFVTQCYASHGPSIYISSFISTSQLEESWFSNMARWLAQIRHIQLMLGPLVSCFWKPRTMMRILKLLNTIINTNSVQFFYHLLKWTYSLRILFHCFELCGRQYNGTSW